MDTPDTHPTMMILKIKVDAAKLTIPINSIGELANYLSVCVARLGHIERPLGPHIEDFRDVYGNVVGQWQIQDGRQPFPE